VQARGRPKLDEGDKETAGQTYDETTNCCKGAMRLLSAPLCSAVPLS